MESFSPLTQNSMLGLALASDGTWAPPRARPWVTQSTRLAGRKGDFFDTCNMWLQRLCNQIPSSMSASVGVYRNSSPPCPPPTHTHPISPSKGRVWGRGGKKERVLTFTVGLLETRNLSGVWEGIGGVGMGRRVRAHVKLSFCRPWSDLIALERKI